MALHTARTPGTDAYVRIYNSDGSEAGACGNGMRCVAEMMFNETGEPTLTFETKAGVLNCWKDDAPAFPPSTWVRRDLPGANPARRSVRRHAPIELQIGPTGKPILRAPSVVSMGNPHAIFWVDDVTDYDLGKLGPPLEHHPIFPERANISLAQVALPRAHRGADLGARRRPDPGVRIGRLRGRGRRGAPGRTDRVATVTCRAATCTSGGANATTTC